MELFEALLDIKCIDRCMAAGGLAGICSWVTTYPQDVVKSRVQGDGWGAAQRYSGPRHCLQVARWYSVIS